MRSALLVVVLGLVVLVGLLVGLQRRLIYFPGPAMPPPPPGIEAVAVRTADDLRLAGWLSRDRADEPLVVVFPGNAGTRADRLPLARALRPHGIGVLLVDYRGYGGNPGSPSEEGLAQDAQAWRAWVSTLTKAPWRTTASRSARPLPPAWRWRRRRRR